MPHPSARAVALLVLLTFSPLIRAQGVTDPVKPDEEVINLSPFLVETGSDTGYLATSTLAGTRLNTSLKDIGAAVSVYTEEFLEDIAVNNIEDILTYTTSTEGGGINGNFSGISGESSDAARDNPSDFNRVRGLASATRTRDYFASDIPSDTFNFGSVTISRGPNAVLAGIGSAGGIINSALKQATFRNHHQAVFRVGSHGTHREELHSNQVLIPKRLALRIDLLNERQGFRQDPTYEKDQRFYLAGTFRMYEPKGNGFLGRTTLRANVEVGSIEGVPPNMLTPVVSMQSWFDNANPAIDKWSVNGALQRFFDGNGNTIVAANVVAGFPLFRNWALIYADPNATVPGVGLTAADLAGVQGFMGTIPAGNQGPGGFLRTTGDRNRERAGYFRTRLTDRNIFDFYNHLMTGAFDFREQDFDATDIRLEQILMGGRAGFELAYNRQNFERSRDFPITGDEEIYIDTNSVLSIRSAGYPQGVPNPNFGRPFIISRDVFKDQFNTSKRESLQATAFFQHDFTQRSSAFSRWLGRHTLSGLLFSTKISRGNRTYASTWDPAGQLNPLTSIGAAPGLFASQVNAWFYLGDSLVNAGSLSDVRLNPIRGTRPEFGQTYTLRVYDPASRSFVTGTSTPLRILTSLRDQEEEIDSGSLTLQSHWLSDHLVTLVGWRRDSSDAFTSADLPRLSTGDLDVSGYRLLPSASQEIDSWTKSVVLKYPRRFLPGFLRDNEFRLFWNDSENFSPVGQRRNIWNEEIGSPSARTREYGVMLSLMRGKVDLRLNRFETSISNDAIANVGNPYGYINTMIVRMVAAHQLNLLPADYGYVHPSFQTFEDVARAFYATIPQRLQDRMGPDHNFDPRFVGTGNNLVWEADTVTNRAAVSDTVSTGLELEAIWNPIRNWRISFGVAKNEAVKAGVARDELEFAYAWISNVQTMYNGALQQGWRNPPTENGPPLVQYNANTVSDIETAAALSGTRSPEIRKWRANLVTRYEFTSGILRGFSIGGAARWQDKVGIGYPFLTDANGKEYADITRPYYGPDSLQVDASLGYRRRITLFRHSVDWNVGINVRNLIADDDLIPIRANADGSWGSVRIPPHRTWMLSTAFRF